MADANEDDLYSAMDWLLTRQDAIQKKLAARHLRNDGLVLYDLSSGCFEGSTCPLAHRGYSRGVLPGPLQVNYGLLTDARGCPVAVSVFEGNTADSNTGERLVACRNGALAKLRAHIRESLLVYAGVLHRMAHA